MQGPASFLVGLYSSHLVHIIQVVVDDPVVWIFCVEIIYGFLALGQPFQEFITSILMLNEEQ